MEEPKQKQNVPLRTEYHLMKVRRKEACSSRRAERRNGPNSSLTTSLHPSASPFHPPAGSRQSDDSSRGQTSREQHEATTR